MCTGRGLIAGVARTRLPYAENPVYGLEALPLLHLFSCDGIRILRVLGSYWRYIIARLKADGWV